MVDVAAGVSALERGRTRPRRGAGVEAEALAAERGRQPASLSFPTHGFFPLYFSIDQNSDMIKFLKRTL